MAGLHDLAEKSGVQTRRGLNRKSLHLLRRSLLCSSASPMAESLTDEDFRNSGKFRNS